MALPYTRTVTVKQTPTVTAGGYTSGDAVGGLLTFANAVRADGSAGSSADANSGEIRTVVIHDKAVGNTSTTYELWLFNATFTADADNDAFTISDADSLLCVGVIPVTDVRASASNLVLTKTSVGLSFNIPSGTSLFGQLVCKGTAPTYGAVSDVQIDVVIAQD
jgi:hypothetical protein